MNVDRNSSAYAYGQYLGAWNQALKRFVEDLTAGFESMTMALPTAGSMQGYAEADAIMTAELYSIQRYEARIRAERLKARAYLRREVRRVRQELGLPLD